MFGASGVFTDVLALKGVSRSFFRILGGKTLTYGEAGGFAILRFREGFEDLFYQENAGTFPAAEALEMLPPSLRPAAKWDDKESSKEFNIDPEKAREIYQAGVYAYFPASRSEQPFWLNQSALIQDEFDVKTRYSTELGKPMFVERGIDNFAQWLLGVITESRLGVKSANYLTDQEKKGIETNEVVVRLDTTYYMRTQQPLLLANKIVQIIFDDPDARFDWAGRQGPRKVGVFSRDRTIASGLDSLSGGQATLLAIFGTILRYGDIAPGYTSDFKAEDLRGVVVIDELDAHMHIDLQTRAIPKLIEMFPNIQFVISSHSPFLVLGMERNFPNNRVRLINLSTGLAVSAEMYDELESALNALRETQVFENQIGIFLQAAESPVIWVAGETDVPYFKTASKLLGYPQLADYFQWIGTPGQSGGGEYTGDSSLNTTIKFLRANPGFTKRTIIAVYDNDAGQNDGQFDNVHIIALQKISSASVEDGIENLLPIDVFTPDVFQEVQKPSGIVGKPKILPELRKKFLCERLCGNDPDPLVFQNFLPYLDRINEIVTITTKNDTAVDNLINDGTTESFSSGTNGDH